MTAADLAKLEALLRDATPGPWASVFQDCNQHIVEPEDIYGKEIIAAGITLVCSYPTMEIPSEQAAKDADLIVAAVNALPQLLAAAREGKRARAALAELVALKDLKDSGFGVHMKMTASSEGKRMDYERRQPLAWAAARAALKDSPT